MSVRSYFSNASVASAVSRAEDGALWHQPMTLEVSLLAREDERGKLETTGPVA